MAVTIRMIAEKAGVSRGTVDRALNNRPGINAEVAEHVRRIAKELHYEPNAAAQALANSKKKMRIAVLLNSGGNLFFDKVRAGLEEGVRSAKTYGIAVDIYEMTGFLVEEQLAHIDALMEKPPHALIITPINDPRIIARLNQIAAAGVSISTLNVDVTGLKKLCFVGCNYIKSGQTAAELLGQMTEGEVPVGILTGSFKILGHSQRVQGFREVCEKDYPRMAIRAVAETDDDDATAYQETRKMLLEHPDIRALYFCAGGIDGGIRTVSDLNRVHSIRIITVDDTDNIKEYIRRGIVNATVCQQPFKQGRDAVFFQAEWLANGRRPPRKHVYTQNEVKLRYNLE